MKKNKLVVCESFKYRDFMFKNYTKECFKEGNVYKLLQDDDGALFISLHVDDTEHLIFLQDLGKEIKDPRFIGKFSELNLEWIVNNYLPSFENYQEIEDWLDGKLNETEEEEEALEKELDEQDLVVDIYSRLQIYAPKLSTGVLEALTGVESILPGELMDEEKGKLLEALNGCISNYAHNGKIEELFMAQYLLFNIINLSKNKW